LGRSGISYRRKVADYTLCIQHAIRISSRKFQQSRLPLIAEPATAVLEGNVSLAGDLAHFADPVADPPGFLNQFGATAHVVGIRRLGRPGPDLEILAVDVNRLGVKWFQTRSV
jgi:hypothetical protein